MGQIRQVYANLAAKTVTVAREAGGSVTVPAKDLHQLPNTVAPADAPTRLLLPYANGVEANGEFADLAGMGGTRWRVVDLLLWKPGTLGAGIAESAADLLRYEDAYIEMLRTFRDGGIVGGGSDVELIKWALRPGLYDWPIGGNTWWQGVMSTLEVLEITAG